MIKCTLRRNLIYLFFLFLYYYLRKIISIIMSQVLKFNISLIYTFLMVLGEFFGGLSIYIYQKKFLAENKKTNNRFKIKLLANRTTMNPIDGRIKIYILIFFASFFDFVEYLIVTYFIPRIASLSPTADQRLCSISTISSSLVCTYTLRMKVGRHQVYSLIGLGLCSGIILITDIFFYEKVNDLGNVIYAYLLVLCHFVFITLTDLIERYLGEYDFINPHKLLATEGFYSIIICSFYSISEKPFSAMGNHMKNLSTGENLLLIFLFFLYFAFSAGVNVYKILCNILYSPMAKSLPAYTFNPIFIIYYFLYENDFQTNGNKNYNFFALNLILSVFIDFFAFIYNECFILFCFGLADGTHYGISQRSRKVSESEKEDLKVLIDIDDDVENNETDDDNSNTK